MNILKIRRDLGFAEWPARILQQGLHKGLISQLAGPHGATFALMDIVCMGTIGFFQEESEQPESMPEDYFEKTDEDGNRIEGWWPRQSRT